MTGSDYPPKPIAERVSPVAAVGLYLEEVGKLDE
jgi:hypothetical protein